MLGRVSSVPGDTYSLGCLDLFFSCFFILRVGACFVGKQQVLKNVKVEYEVLEGWEEDISECKEWDDLPAAAQVYVRRVEVRHKPFNGLARFARPLEWTFVGYLLIVVRRRSAAVCIRVLRVGTKKTSRVSNGLGLAAVCIGHSYHTCIIAFRAATNFPTCLFS